MAKIASKITRPGTRFLNDLGNFTFNDNLTNKVFFTGTYASSYAINITMAAKDTRGGSGNPLVMRTYSDRNVAITLNVKEWNLAYVAASVGSKIEHGLSELFVIEQAVNVDSAGSALLDPLPVGPVSVRFEDGRRQDFLAGAGGELDLSAYNAADKCVFVTYMFNAEAKSVIITADKSPLIGRLVMKGIVSDSRIGQVGHVAVDIPSFALDGNLTVNFNADGTTSDTQMVGVALALDGSDCKDGMVYGYVKEYVEDDIAPQLVDITASPSPIQLPVGDSQGISVVGSRGLMYTDVGILPAECTYLSGDSGVATVDSDGLVTGIAIGDTEITVTHTATGLTDSVEVNVGNF